MAVFNSALAGESVNSIPPVETLVKISRLAGVGRLSVAAHTSALIVPSSFREKAANSPVQSTLLKEAWNILDVVFRTVLLIAIAEPDTLVRWSISPSAAFKPSISSVGSEALRNAPRPLKAACCRSSSFVAESRGSGQPPVGGLVPES